MRPSSLYPALVLLSVSIPAAAQSRDASSPPHAVDWLAYERGEMGVYPQRTFHSSDARAPYVRVSWHEACDSESYVFFTPRGKGLSSNRALMLDAQGQLVWHLVGEGAIDNLQVQRYQGEDYLTYWTGDDEFWGHGSGYYKMVGPLSRYAFTRATTCSNVAITKLGGRGGAKREKESFAEQPFVRDPSF